MTSPPSVHDPALTLARSPRPGFVAGFVLGVVVGFSVGVLVGSKGCPPVPVPGATSGGEAVR